MVSYSEYMCGTPRGWHDFDARLTQFLPLTGVGLVAIVAGVRSALLLPASAPKGLNLKRVFWVVAPYIGGGVGKATLNQSG